MSDVNTSIDPDREPFEQEWEDSVQVNKSEEWECFGRYDYEVYPAVALYIGQALGPFAPFFLSLFLLRKRLSWRDVIILLSLTVTAWLSIQGVTLFMGSKEPYTSYDWVREILNFIFAGVVLIYLTKKDIERSHSFELNKIIYSGLLMIGSLLVTIYTPKAWLVWAGQ